MRRNYGDQDYLAAICLEVPFTFRNYSSHMSKMRAFMETVKNTLCLLLYEFRAFPVRKVFSYKDTSFNSVIVFKPRKKVGSKRFFNTPVGYWENSTYY